MPTRLALALALATALLALVVTTATGAPINRTTSLISQPTGVADPFSDGAFHAGNSADGSRTFISTNQKLTADDLDSGREDIYERTGGITTLISGPTGAPDPDTADVLPQFVSADGSRVVFTTSQKMTTDDNDSDRVDIYERAGGITTLISKEPDVLSDPDTADVFFRGASSDGSRVFFETTQNLGDDDSNRRDVYVRSAGATTVVSRPTGIPDPDSGNASFVGASDDGGRVFFTTSQKMTTEDLDTNRIDVYERVLGSGITTLISQPTGVGDPDSDHINFDSQNGDVSADGSRVFFTTTQKLTADDLDSARTDVYERAGGTTALVSGPTGVSDPNTGNATFEGISADGTRVFFVTNQPLTSDDGDVTPDVYQRSGGTTTLISQPTGVPDSPSPSAAFEGASADGSRVFFSTVQEMTSGDDDNGFVDVYERAAGTTTLLTQSTGVADPDNSDNIFRRASDDGTRVFFETVQKMTADDGDTDWIDVYERTDGVTSLISKPSCVADPDTGDAEIPQLSFTRSVSADGTRVFFETTQKLVAGDLDAGLFDVYVAAEDTTAPQTTITGGPSGTTGDSTPSFGFASNEAGSCFQCKVDGGPFAPCSSPLTLGPLADGAHSFQVRALDGAGNFDASPALRSFSVATSSPFVPLGPDTIAPLGRLSGRKTQKLGRSVTVTVTCPDEACTALATASTSVPTNLARRFKLGRAKRSIARGAKAKLKLKLSKKARRAAKRALRKRRKVRVKVKVTLTDAAGNARVLRRTVRLKR